MFRSIIAFCISLLLAGCWQSEEPLFGEGDWAKLDIDGRYDVETVGVSSNRRTVTLTTLEDGSIESITQTGRDAAAEVDLLGLVAISGGTGRFFLAVGRSDDGDIYYVAQLTHEDSLAFYFPYCAGTTARVGLIVEDGGKGSLVCTFTSKQALLEAALEAERFLSRPYIVRVLPVQVLTKSELDEEAPEVDGTFEPAE